jgi:hypothetical protein
MDPLILDPTTFSETIEKTNPDVRDFFSDGKKDFSNFDSVSQGEIGDCWLLAPMAALARSPKLRRLLHDNFTIDVAEKKYSIKLYDISGGAVFKIDGRLIYLPAVEGYKSDLLFAGQQQHIPEKAAPAFKSLWFAFIEKAVALKLGGYHNLDGGDPDSPDVKQASLGFNLLTGKTANTIYIDVTTDFSTKIRELLASGAAIVYTTKSNAEILETSLEKRTIKTSPEDDADKSGLNLLEDHAYVINRISRDGTVQLYNPHGEFPSVAARNKARPLTMADAIFFGKRLDIISIAGGGKFTRRKFYGSKRKSTGRRGF